MDIILFFVAIFCVAFILFACAYAADRCMLVATNKHVNAKRGIYNNFFNSFLLFYYSLKISLSPFTFLIFVLQNAMIGLIFFIKYFYGYAETVYKYTELFMPLYVWGILFIAVSVWLLYGTIQLYDVFDNTSSITHPLILTTVLHSVLATVSFLNMSVNISSAIFSVNVLILLYLIYKIANPPKIWKFN